MNLESAVAAYLSHKQGTFAGGTFVKYRMTLTDFTAYFGASSPDVGDINAGHILAWRYKFIKAGVKPQSINKYMDRVRSFFSYAVKRGWIAVNPCHQID